MATIKEVAAMASVSVATVSRWINGTADIRPETARRIADAVQALGYLPNRQARNLRTTHTNFILVLMPSVENTFLSHVIRGVQNVGRRCGYSILIGTTQSSPAVEQSYLDLVRSRGVDGIICISPSVGTDVIRELHRQYPILQCSEYVTDDVPYVTIDNRAAARAITGLLLDSGCRRPALISSALPIVSLREREAGFADAMRERGLTPEPALVVRGPLGYNAGKRAAGMLLPQRPDGVLALADIMALGAIRRFTDAGLRVPGDVSVAGFDGIPLSRESRPPLTTVIQPAFEIGKRAAELIIRRIRGQPVPMRTLLPYRIARRGSVGPGV